MLGAFTDQTAVSKEEDCGDEEKEGNDASNDPAESSTRKSTTSSVLVLPVRAGGARCGWEGDGGGGGGGACYCGGGVDGTGDVDLYCADALQSVFSGIVAEVTMLFRPR